MRDITDTPVVSTLQYSVDSLDEFRATAYQCGLQAMDKAQQGSLTPIYFTTNLTGAGFDLKGEKTTVASTQNYYKIKDSFSKF